MKLSQPVVRSVVTEELKNKNYSKVTIGNYLYALKLFFSFLDFTERVNDLRETQKKDVAEFEKFLFSSVKTDCKGKKHARFSRETQFRFLLNLSSTFKILLKKDLIMYSPFETFELTKCKTPATREGISKTAMIDFLDSIELKGTIGIRDRIMFELLYGTGIRLAELFNLNVTDVDLSSRKLFIEQGKGKKDRILPMGKSLVKYIEIYLLKSRPRLLKHAEGESRKALFLSLQGTRLGKKAIHKQLRARLKDSELGIEKLNCHMFRHSFATHLMENGAAVKKVKELLGHNRISSTVLYTHFNIMSLKKINRQYHSRENEFYKELTKEEEKRYIEIIENSIDK
jgi:site-specific recombinase XerD